jgi:hypothetical protein
MALAMLLVWWADASQARGPLYLAALAELGAQAALKDGSHLALHGLRAAHASL